MLTGVDCPQHNTFGLQYFDCFVICRLLSSCNHAPWDVLKHAALADGAAFP